MSPARAAPALVGVPEARGWAALVPLLRELGDLKRIRSAGRQGSIATRLFHRGWSELVAGSDPGTVALATTAAALAAARLGDLDAGALAGLGMGEDEARRVLLAGFDDVASAISEPLRSRLREQVGVRPATRSAPPFVAALSDQPRAGATCPGRSRVVLQPPENHAEHCLVVSIYGVLLAPMYGAEPSVVFLAAMSHHLHNAAMPDSGFTGEMLLGANLEGAVRHATELALAELPPDLGATVAGARAVLPNAETPEGRAFHAADVIDRVLEIDQHLAAARLTMAEVLGDMALVHDGPVKPFHDRVLREAGLP